MVLETDLSPFALALAALPFGLIVGSFLNVVILRLPVQLKNGWRRESEGFFGLTLAGARTGHHCQTGIALPQLRRGD